MQQNGANVDFTLTSQLSSGVFNDAFIGLLWFSWNGTGTLNTTNPGAPQCTGCNLSASDFTFALNSFGNAGYRAFDIQIDLQDAAVPSGGRFDDNDILTWTMLGASVSDFDDLVEGKGSKPEVLAFAHIQRVAGGNCSVKYVGGGGATGSDTGTGGDASACVSVPEPSSLGLLGIVLLGLGGLVEIRRRNA